MHVATFQIYKVTTRGDDLLDLASFYSFLLIYKLGKGGSMGCNVSVGVTERERERESIGLSIQSKVFVVQLLDRPY